ncbi:MAG: SAM-dependent methyltransferase [Bacilli bacterium]|nr:SAM-dependent methyltransferase [Bacilli bacterium]
MGSLVRLNAALDWIDLNDRLADIGCDHGYLAIEALKKGIPFVQLIDNKEGPLNVARNNLNKYDYNNKTKFTLASGLLELDSKVNCVAILGMGGELIINILEEGYEKSSNVNKFILEANTKVPSLRKYLFNNKYEIVSEKIVKENNKYYELILCKKTNSIIEYDDLDIEFGPILRKEKSPIFIEKWTNVYNKYQNIINKSEIIPDKLVKDCKMIEEIL